MGGGNLMMVPVDEKFYYIDLTKRDIKLITECKFTSFGLKFSKDNLPVFFNNISFLRDGYMVLTITDDWINSSLDDVVSDKNLFINKIGGKYTLSLNENSNPIIIIAKLK